ncbi:hypothetical protein G7Y79_00001g003080 [Physcia stellaris]|nr:hypothetical protein G7Y79_00001g003080 [Physcia stellaris]
MALDNRVAQNSNLSPVSAGESVKPARGRAQPSATPPAPRRPAATKTTTVMAIVTDTMPFKSASAKQTPTRPITTSSSTSSYLAAASSDIPAASIKTPGSGIPPGTLTIAIAVPIVLIAVLAPLFILTILTCRRKRRARKRRSSQSVSKKLKLLDRPQDKLEYRPKGKYGPATWQRPLNSFSGFEFNFSRPRTVLSAISARSPRATTPRPSTPRVPPVRVPTGAAPQIPPAAIRRPALSVLSRFANTDGIQDPPPPYVTRPMTLAHPYFRPSIPTQQLTDTPQSARSVSPQLLVATPVEIQSLSGPYAPISQVLSSADQDGRASRQPSAQRMSISPPQRAPRSPFHEASEETPHTSANLQGPFSAPSPAPTNVSGLSFDPSAWVASYERNSRVSSVDGDTDSRMDPHQIV